MLPCNVIVQEREPEIIEVSAVDPIASMMAIENEALGEVTAQVRAKLQHVIEQLYTQSNEKTTTGQRNQRVNIKIEQEYRELYKYLNETTVTIPCCEHPELTVKTFSEYL